MSMPLCGFFNPTMQTRPFKQLEVFTQTPYFGNPLAVVLNGEGLTAEQMQRFTEWTNLSECTFLLPPTHAEADYRVRIFCPGRELPFAGHPTLGSCHAWLEAGGMPKAKWITQECAAGLVRIRRETGTQRLAFAAPPRLRSGPLDAADLERIARGLGIRREAIVAHAWCDNGPNWRGIMLASAEEVLALSPDHALLGQLDLGIVAPHATLGQVGSHATSEAPDFEVRAFFPGNSGLCEDPVTGSLNAAIAQWLIGDGLAPSKYLVSQGTALGRAGRVYVEQFGDDTWIGGSSVTCVAGSVVL
jgi:PhzF family phenazine biosynthesis protein